LLLIGFAIIYSRPGPAKGKRTGLGPVGIKGRGIIKKRPEDVF